MNRNSSAGWTTLNTKKQILIDLSKEDDLDGHERDYWTGVIVRPKQVISWTDFVIRRRRRRI
jgi:hypothetical protein